MAARMWRAAVAAVLGLVATLGGGLLPGAAPSARAGPSVRDQSWYLAEMRIAEAQRYSRGAGVTVAVIDAGVDATSADLVGQVLPGVELGRDERDGAVIVGAGDGRIDPDGHGTGMAGLIAARGDAPDRLIGVAPEAKILPIRIVQGADGTFTDAQLVAGVKWAIDHGATVVNMSIGRPPTPDAGWKHELIAYAAAHEVVLVAATGNVPEDQAGTWPVDDPAAIAGVVAVGGLARDGHWWRGSATGPQVTVAAPAERLPLSVPPSSGAEYRLASGTSGATALVTGVVALIRSRYPALSAADVINRLIQAATDRGPQGRDPQYGFGAVDAAAALTADVSHVDANPLLLAPSAGVSPASPEHSTSQSPPPAGGRALLYVLLVVGAALGFGLLVLAVALSRRTPRAASGPPRMVSGAGSGTTWSHSPSGAFPTVSRTSPPLSPPVAPPPPPTGSLPVAPPLHRPLAPAGAAPPSPTGSLPVVPVPPHRPPAPTAAPPPPPPPPPGAPVPGQGAPVVAGPPMYPGRVYGAPMGNPPGPMPVPVDPRTYRGVAEVSEAVRSTDTMKLPPVLIDAPPPAPAPPAPGQEGTAATKRGPFPPVIRTVGARLPAWASWVVSRARRGSQQG